ncbi:hypothetical protein BVZ69_00397B, partial [Haemophilus influenzae]
KLYSSCRRIYYF